MAAARYDLIGRRAIEAGATFARSVVYKDDAGSPIDLTGYTARMQIRPSYDASSSYLSLTTENGRITITGATGTISLTLSATETAGLTFGSAFYDLELINGATVIRFMEGKIDVKPRVTQ